MIEISAVIVLPEDEELLKCYRFDGKEILEECIDIAEMILEDEDLWQLSNQLDDMINFRKSGEKYNQRVYFILAACRLLWDEKSIRKAVEDIFAFQNSPPTSVRDETDMEEFIARMTKCVMTSSDIDQVCDWLFKYYMGKKPWGSKIHDKRLRITRMKIARGRKLDYDFNHKKVQLVIPELKS